MIVRKHAVIVLLAAPLVLAAAFVGCCTLASGCRVTGSTDSTDPAVMNDPSDARNARGD